MTQDQFNDLKNEFGGIYSALDFYKKSKLRIEKEMQVDNIPSNLLNATMDIIDYTFMEYINSRLTTIVEKLKQYGG